MINIFTQLTVFVDRILIIGYIALQTLILGYYFSYLTFENFYIKV